MNYLIRNYVITQARSHFRTSFFFLVLLPSKCGVLGSYPTLSAHSTSSFRAPTLFFLEICTGVLISPQPDQVGNKLMYLSEREFPSAPCFAGRTKLDDSSRLDVVETARVTDMLPSCIALLGRCHGASSVRSVHKY